MSANTDLLEQAVVALGELLDEVVFVGGATLGLWIIDPGAPPIRPTNDVDVIVEVTTRRDYYAFEERLRGKGFHDEGTVVCRWTHESGLLLDAIPADAGLLGFENRWQREALPHAVVRGLPSGAEIRVVPPAYLLATKLEAFADRGKTDYVGSRDFGDLVALSDGREALSEEIRNASPELRTYIATELGRIIEDPRAREVIAAHLPPDEASQARAEAIVFPRLLSCLRIASNVPGTPL